MDIRFLNIARIELDKAVKYYNTESFGLGDEFLLEIVRTLERIKLFPNAWHPFSENTKRCRLHRFPYGVIYEILETEILIVAIAHLHREPDYWKDREG
jgi:mRNA-degrading endonuclease RelE of RelBE toxin-antitoxin system